MSGTYYIRPWINLLYFTYKWKKFPTCLSNISGMRLTCLSNPVELFPSVGMIHFYQNINWDRKSIVFSLKKPVEMFLRAIFLFNFELKFRGIFPTGNSFLANFFQWGGGSTGFVTQGCDELDSWIKCFSLLPVLKEHTFHCLIEFISNPNLIHSFWLIIIPC